jgi:hypothetical protein
MRSPSSSNQDLHTLPIHALLPRYTWLTLISIWMMWAIFVLLLFMVFPGNKANAQSFKNNHPLPVIVIWRAAGCKGVAIGVTLVCSSITANAGKTVGYQFKPGTSYRQIRLKGPANCNARGNFDAPADDAVSIDASCNIVRYSFAEGDGTLNIRNLKTTPVTVYWKSDQCAGIQNGILRVCYAATIPAGGQSFYRFKDDDTAMSWTYSSAQCPVTATQKIYNSIHVTRRDSYVEVPQDGCDITNAPSAEVR